ncbi:hypothetical protein KHQ89_02265 [Mycoplasmatota bacterium]|nr:hypothetical protein KHQ89_02265 [Mycoplasmatota bacterium]
MSSLIVGVNQQLISFNNAYKQAKLTLDTLYNHVEHYHGFFYHFLDIKTGKRFMKNEISTIDTALCLCGVVAVSSFFKQEIEVLANQILDRVDWKHFVFKKENKLYFHMAYNPDKDGDYTHGKAGFVHQWDMFAEQLMMYVLAAKQIPELALDLYHGFKRYKVNDHGKEFVMTPGNTLFVYQFPLAWFNLKDIVDDQGFSWFDNAKAATLNHQRCSLEHQDKYKTFSTYLFGFTASITEKGYRVFKGLPNIQQELVTDGTVSPSGPLGSFPLIPDIAYQSLLKMLKIKGLYGPYGLYDAFNIKEDSTWITNRYYGINQGLILLMLDAVTNQSVYDAFMQHPNITYGMEVLRWKKR